MTIGPYRASAYRAGRRRRWRARGTDVLIHPEAVVRVIGPLDLRQPIVVVAVARPHPLLALVHHHVHVSTAGGVWVKRLEVVDAPAADDLGIGGVVIDTGEDRAPDRIAVAPRGVGWADVV